MSYTFSNLLENHSIILKVNGIKCRNRGWRPQFDWVLITYFNYWEELTFKEESNVCITSLSVMINAANEDNRTPSLVHNRHSISTVVVYFHYCWGCAHQSIMLKSKEPYYFPGTVCTRSLSIPPAPLWEKYYHPEFTDEETEAEWWENLCFNLIHPSFQVLWLLHHNKCKHRVFGF